MCLILRDLTSQECLKKKKKTEEVMIYARTQMHTLTKFEQCNTKLDKCT